jgi:hypothetical protein
MIQSAFDEANGGFGDAPKLPQPAVLEFMLRAAGRGIQRAGIVADLSLRKMALGGIYDQLGGGFHRYAVDKAWRVPRFEKMLSDNAQLVRVYVHAWQLRRQPLYRRIAEETIEYLLHDLSDPSGGFYSSRGADTVEGDGAYYTWSLEEFESVAPGAVQHYGVTSQGNLNGANVLSAGSVEPPAAQRAALIRRRSDRKAPERDEKILTSWNGLAIAALAEAGAAFSRVDLVEAARRAARFVLQRSRDTSGRLFHSYRGDRAAVAGMLEDYACMAEGLYALWEATLEESWVQAAGELCTAMLDLFWDEEAGGLTTTSKDGDGLLPRRMEYLDASTPSPSAVASLVLEKMAILTGRSEYAEKAALTLERAPQSSLSQATWLSAVDFHLATATEIVILGPMQTMATRALLRQVWERYLPNKVMAGGAAFASPMLANLQMQGDAPTAYVSEGAHRKGPITDPGELGRSLKIYKPPSPTQVGAVTKLISNALQRRHFFESLQNPAWIEPLRDAGLFDAPLEPIRDYSAGTVGSPPWPQSRYLARMAAIRPAVVHEVALAVPETENVLIQEDLADAALAMPPALAADFVSMAKQWIRSPYLLHMPEKLGVLMQRLAEAGLVDQALELAGAVLALEPSDAEGAGESGAPAGVPEPKARFRRFEYEQILTKHLPVLVDAGRLATINLLADLLDRAIALSQPEGADLGPGDNSHVWRPAVHEHELNVDPSFRDPLVTATVAAAEQIARSYPETVPELVAALEARRWNVFRRIALHLLRVRSASAREMVRQRLTTRALFQDPHFHHEYLLLARDHFGSLPPGEQARILGWVEEGPPQGSWQADAELAGVDPGDAGQMERYRAQWTLRRLEMLEAELPRDYRELRDELASAHGRPARPDFLMDRSGQRIDPTTPRQVDELRAMTMGELTAFLGGWRAAGGVGSPTVEGLVKKLEGVAASEPVRFAAAADEFKGVGPRYVRALLSGLRGAAEGYELDWAPLLRLCKWAASADIRPDPASWLATRAETARLLSAGFSQQPGQMPFSLRKAAWDVLSRLTEGRPAGGLTEGRPNGGLAEDASRIGELATNAKVEAMQAVARYAIWVRRHLEAIPEGREQLRTGFKQMPEVVDVLDFQFQRDPAREVRAVYGRWFPWLAMIDPQWADSKRRRIFGRLGADGRDLAWDSFIGFAPPHVQLLKLMAAEYEKAVGRIGSYGGPVPGGVAPEERLAEHLMIFYFQGQLSPDDPLGLLARFFAGAPDRLRAYALGFVGKTVEAQKADLPGPFVARLQALWNGRLMAGRSRPGEHRAELGAFGWWFSTGKLGDAWALDQLLEVLQLTGRVEATDKVIAKLKDLAETLPDKAVAALSLILALEQESVNLVTWIEDARQVLNTALRSGNPAARSASLELFDFFDVSQLEELIRWE